jgi:hypothetical protein
MISALPLLLTPVLLLLLWLPLRLLLPIPAHPRLVVNNDFEVQFNGCALQVQRHSQAQLRTRGTHHGIRQQGVHLVKAVHKIWKSNGL